MESPLAHGAVLFAKDVTRLTTFYSAVVGLAVAAAEPGWTCLESPGYQLVIHGIPEAIAAGIEITDPPARREDVAVKLVFPVASLAAARVQAAQLGGGLEPPEREWEFGDVRLCDGVDPEGNVVQFRERA